MTRPLRINLAGGWYHVTARGNNRQAIYDDDREREQPGLKALRVRIAFEDVVKAVEKEKRETWGLGPGHGIGGGPVQMRDDAKENWGGGRRSSYRGG